MARGRKPEPGEPSRGSAISRAFRERKANQLIELTQEVANLKTENQRVKNENLLLRQLISNNSKNEDLTSFSPNSDGNQGNGETQEDKKRKREDEGEEKPLSFCSACGCPDDREIEVRLVSVIVSRTNHREAFN